MKGFLIWLLLCGLWMPLRAEELKAKGATDTLPGHRVLSVLLNGTGGLGLAYEQDLNPWIGVLGELSYLKSDFVPGADTYGAQLEARAYPFGKAPSGFFGCALLRAASLYDETATPDDTGGFTSDVQRVTRGWYGAGLGYQWIFFNHVSLQLEFSLQYPLGTKLSTETGNGIVRDILGLGFAF